MALRSGFSRIPVVGENLDDIVGIVYLKDVARRAQDSERGRSTRVEDVMRPAVYVPESKPVDVLLREMQAMRSHMVIVIDEYGGTAGLATIEDILEEIVGEITDEYDNERPPVERLDADTARVTARLAVEDLSDVFDVFVPDRDDVETVGGLLAEALGRVPIPGTPRWCTAWNSPPRASAGAATGSTPSSSARSCGRAARRTGSDSTPQMPTPNASSEDWRSRRDRSRS